jgi:hypothetical protein
MRAAPALVALGIALGQMTGGAAADEGDRGRRLNAAEIEKVLSDKTFMGNVGKLQLPIRAYVDPDKTFRMSVSVDWIDRYDDDKKKTHVLDEHGTWWLKPNLVCLKFVRRLAGAQDCFRVYRTADDLRFFFDDCTMVSTDYCQTSEPAFIAAVAAGDKVLPPTPPAWELRCTAGCRRD